MDGSGPVRSSTTRETCAPTSLLGRRGASRRRLTVDLDFLAPYRSRPGRDGSARRRFRGRLTVDRSLLTRFSGRLTRALDDPGTDSDVLTCR